MDSRLRKIFRYESVMTERLTYDFCSNRAELLLKQPSHVIDLMPRQVPAERGKAWFAAEKYFLQRDRLSALYQRFTQVIIRLGCYYDLMMQRIPKGQVCEGEGTWEAPGLEEIERQIVGLTKGGRLNVLFPDADMLIALDGGDLHMTVYHPSADLLQLTEQIVSAEGLFIRPAV